MRCPTVVTFVEIENNEVEASFRGATKSIDFECKFEIHINPLSRDIKQAVG